MSEPDEGKLSSPVLRGVGSRKAPLLPGTTRRIIMRVEPKIEEVVNGPRGMLQGINVALVAECLVSAVGLMFAALDSLAALVTSSGDSILNDR
jgi:hypothetical protein